MQTNRRFWEIMIGLFLFIFGLAALGGGDAFLPVLLGLIGLYLLARQFNASTSGLSRELDELEEEPPRRQTGADQVYAHAVDAVRRAGRDPGETQVLPVDIGVMAFHAGDEPVVHRTQPIYDDVDYIQPFVQLRLPTRARGRIRFEIIDGDGETLFIHEDYHQLQRGRNLVTPAARLPIHDAQMMSAPWELRVSADGVLLAAHRFGWREREEKIIRRQLHADGEITSDLRAAMLDSQPGPMSLDELLAAQEEAERQSRRA